MEARPSAVVFFSFFRRVYARDILLSRRRLLLLLLHRCLLLLLLLDFVTRARKGRGREPKPNETRFSLIRSTSSNPQRGTRTRARTHVKRTFIRGYAYARVYAYTRTYANASTRVPSRSRPRFFASFAPVPPSRTPFFLPSRFILRQRPGEVCRRPLLILSRRSTASPAVSLALLPCRFCVSYPLHARRPSHSFALRALSLEQPINSVGRRRVRTTILSLSSHRPTVLTPI